MRKDKKMKVLFGFVSVVFVVAIVASIICLFSGDTETARKYTSWVDNLKK